MEISMELVPRSRASLEGDVALLRREFPSVRRVNIPDLLRFELRSWQACAIARGAFDRAIPHIRAMDFPIHAAGALAARLSELGLREALIVRGDSPQEFGHPVHSTTSAELIRALKAADENLRLYAAFDPYRQGLRAEIDGVHEKLAAGASGLFTQPLFDLRLADACLNLLPKIEVFWGVSPVVTPASRRYWEVKNQAVFPREFEATLTWNRAFAATCLDWARGAGAALYFMPIRVDLREYLGGLMERA